MIHGLRKGPDATGGTIMDVYLGVLPFFVLMMLAIVLIMIFPQIALWLPTTMRGN